MKHFLPVHNKVLEIYIFFYMDVTAHYPREEERIEG